MSSTYQAFVDGVLSRAFPEGEAPNLRKNHERFVLDALLDLQRWLPRLRVKHEKVYDAATRYWRCGETVMTRPAGATISRLYTLEDVDDCGKVYYDAVDVMALDSQELRARVCSSLTYPGGWQGYTDYDYEFGLPPGFVPVSPELDRGFRSPHGLFAVDDDNIRIFPAVESTERVVLLCRGPTYQWAPADLIDFDTEVETAVLIHVRAMVALHEDCNQSVYQGMRAEYIASRSDLIVDDRRQLAEPFEPAPVACCDPCNIGWLWVPAAPVTPPEPPTPEPVPTCCPASEVVDDSVYGGGDQSVATTIDELVAKAGAIGGWYMQRSSIQADGPSQGKITVDHGLNSRTLEVQVFRVLNGPPESLVAVFAQTRIVNPDRVEVIFNTQAAIPFQIMVTAKTDQP